LVVKIEENDEEEENPLPEKNETLNKKNLSAGELTRTERYARAINTLLSFADEERTYKAHAHIYIYIHTHTHTHTQREIICSRRN